MKPILSSSHCIVSWSTLPVRFATVFFFSGDFRVHVLATLSQGFEQMEKIHFACIKGEEFRTENIRILLRLQFKNRMLSFWMNIRWIFIITPKCKCFEFSTKYFVFIWKAYFNGFWINQCSVYYSEYLWHSREHCIWLIIIGNLNGLTFVWSRFGRNKCEVKSVIFTQKESGFGFTWIWFENCR